MFVYAMWAYNSNLVYSNSLGWHFQVFPHFVFVKALVQHLSLRDYIQIKTSENFDWFQMFNFFNFFKLVHKCFLFLVVAILYKKHHSEQEIFPFVLCKTISQKSKKCFLIWQLPSILHFLEHFMYSFLQFAIV